MKLRRDAGANVEANLDWYTPTHVEDEKVIAKLRFMDSSWGHDSRRLFVC
jgi:hypothetical protein